jgi:5-methylcytosine-specific restriction endonuclease McrA
MLARGMLRNAYRDLESSEEWIRIRARRKIANLDVAVAEALPRWINDLLAKPDNRTRDFKIMRAHRRGLLRMGGAADYPGNWKEVAHRVRARDKKCLGCGDASVGLDVHHIIYLSNYGTNRQENLISLCRSCHEKQHGRTFDFAEAYDPQSPSPIQSQPNQRPNPGGLGYSEAVCPAAPSFDPEQLPETECAVGFDSQTGETHQGVRAQIMGSRQWGFLENDRSEASPSLPSHFQPEQSLTAVQQHRGANSKVPYSAAPSVAPLVASIKKTEQYRPFSTGKMANVGIGADKQRPNRRSFTALDLFWLSLVAVIIVAAIEWSGR